LLVAALGLPSAASAASRTLEYSWSAGQHPPHRRLSVDEAARIAAAQPRVRAQAQRFGTLSAAAFTYGARGWEVDFSSHGLDRAEVHIDDRSGRVVDLWTGRKLEWRLARGSRALSDEHQTGRLTNATWVWIALVCLFLAPFVDPRRPWRRLHLDLAALLALAISHVALDHGSLELSVWLAWPVLAWLALRFGAQALRGRMRDDGPLVPFAPAWLLAAGVVALLVVRIVLNLTDSIPGDVAYAGVGGADRIAHGLDLYTAGGQQYDTYGPVNYLLYWPFIKVFGFHGQGDVHLWAAHAAAIVFDVLTAAALAAIGMRVRRGREGRMLGLALAYAWVAYPYSWYVLAWNTNDATVPMLLLPALASLAIPLVAGVFLGAAAAGKFAPAVVGPLLTRQVALRVGWRGGLIFALAAIGVATAAVVVYLPDGGIREFYDATLGFQLGRQSPFSPWGLHPGLDPIAVALKVAACAAIVGGFVWRRRLDIPRIAAWTAMTILLVQLSLTYWVETYVVWFAPFAFVAALACSGSLAERDGARAPIHRTSRFPAGQARL
jgi:hypothetical protein